MRTRTALTRAEVAALDPTDYADGCENCVAKPIPREEYLAIPFAIVPAPAGHPPGIVANYAHHCGHMWFTSYAVH